MKFVIDASVAARWFILQESNANSEEVLQRVLSEPESFAVPELFFFEVLGSPRQDTPASPGSLPGSFPSRR